MTDHHEEWVKAAEAKRNPAPVEKSKGEQLKDSDDSDPFCLARKTLSDGRVVRLYQLISGISIKLARDDESFAFDVSWDYFNKDIKNGINEYIKYNGDSEPEGWTRRL